MVPARSDASLSRSAREGRHGAPAPRRRVVWIGDASGDELALARDAVAALPEVSLATVAAPPTAIDATSGDEPLCVLLANDRTTDWPPARVLALARRWPLARLIAVSGSLGDGRRRGGGWLPGVEEIAWHDVAGRLAAWVADLDGGSPGSLGLPATARREDRLLEAPRFGPGEARHHPRKTVAVVARDPVALEGLVGLVTALGHRVAATVAPRPPVDGDDACVLWDAERLAAADIEWLRLLVANRPGREVVILDSFPRGDIARTARAAGAMAVLGRPVALESLAGVLDRRGKVPDAST